MKAEIKTPVLVAVVVIAVSPRGKKPTRTRRAPVVLLAAVDPA